jgi:hypothetical protein
MTNSMLLEKDTSMPHGAIHAFYNDLPVEEQTPNTLQYEDRDGQSRADNYKQQTENCDDK